MCEIIVVTSGKGGVGKTTTTANLGVGLSLLGKKLLMIDTDIGLRNLDVVMGLGGRDQIQTRKLPVTDDCLPDPAVSFLNIHQIIKNPVF